MSRDVFPRHNDRRLIRAFLAGKPLRLKPDEYADIEYALELGGILRLTGASVAWFDNAGALCAKIAPGQPRAFSILAINHIMVELGQPGKAIHRDVDPVTGATRALRFFFDDAPITEDQPFTLAGPVGVLAHRASLGPRPAFSDP